MLRGTRRRIRISGAQWSALGLLLVLLSGLSLTTLTHDWIGALPNHDHLLYGARAFSLHHHAHQDDPLDQALRALQPAAPALTHEEEFAQTQAATVPDRPTGVVSLKLLSGVQPELNSYTALGLLALFALVRVAVRREPLPAATETAYRGCAHAPVPPPPRFA